MGRLNDWYVADLLEILRKRGETVSAVESCTGGLLSARITDISGSSDVFRQSYVTYCDEAKHHLVKVKKSTLRKYTAVSQKTAEAMAKGGAKVSGADACLSGTGYAGPAMDEKDTNVGLVYVGCFYLGRIRVKELHLTGTRRQIREAAVDEALRLLNKSLKSHVEKRRWMRP